MKSNHQKRHLTHAEEFDILKIVLNKFLVVAVGIILIGFYKLVDMSVSFKFGISIILIGIVLLLLFTLLLVKEFNFVK
ncbi:MAG: hypothetical protein H6502_05435 [Candidatus Woesearchaeota archaeon]|nr:MAG: hypothetical protein H6502_05435 [Candidatus Woesearchaeota archaeon]